MSMSIATEFVQIQCSSNLATNISSYSSSMNKGQAVELFSGHPYSL